MIPGDRSGAQEPFELLNPLGRGGFAETYLVKVLDPTLIREWGEEVVIKIPLNKRVERVLINELIMNAGLHMNLRSFDHKHVVRYLGFEEFRGVYVMVMEYVPDGSLRKLIGRIGMQRPLDISTAVEITQGILEGLMVIHGAGLIHRDIKPENILMHGHTPKIADLGLGRMLEKSELAYTKYGTEHYAPPEIIDGKGAGHNADLWSLGVTLFEMVTGQLPFSGSGMATGKVIDSIRSASAPIAHKINKDVPPALSDVINRALEKKPSDRFPSAKVMLDTLRKLKLCSDKQVERELEEAREMMASPELIKAAKAKLDELSSTYPDDARVYQGLGEYYNRCRQFHDATNMFQKCVELQPENGLFHWDLALAFQNRGMLSDAARELEAAMELGLEASLQRYANTLLRLLRKGSG